MRKAEIDKGHIVKVFVRLILSGKVQAAVRWLSKCRRGRVLQASELVKTTDERGNASKTSVYEVLNRKHPNSHVLLCQRYSDVMNYQDLRMW